MSAARPARTLGGSAFVALVVGSLETSAAIRATLMAEPRSVAQARALVRRFLDEGHARRRTDDALVVVSELVSNAIRHGGPGPFGGRIEMEIKLRRAKLFVRVVNAAPGGPGPRLPTPDDERDAGRGLAIVGRLASWSARVVDGRHEVCAQLDLR